MKSIVFIIPEPYGYSGFDKIKKPPFETLYNLALALPFLA